MSRACIDRNKPVMKILIYPVLKFIASDISFSSFHIATMATPLNREINCEEVPKTSWKAKLILPLK